MGARALALYRSFIRASKPLTSLPSQNRRQLILRRVRHEIETNKGVAEEGKLEFLFQLGEVQLESVLIQAKHLAGLHQEGHLKS